MRPGPSRRAALTSAALFIDPLTAPDGGGAEAGASSPDLANARALPSLELGFLSVGMAVEVVFSARTPCCGEKFALDLPTPKSFT